MPNDSVPAVADHLPALTRRSLLAGAASAATSVGAGPAVPSVAAAHAGDTPLTALASRFTAVLTAYQAADRHRAERETVFLTEHPDPPRALTAKGPLGKLLRHKGAWWYTDELAALLRDRYAREHWRAARTMLPLAEAYEAEVRAFEHACGFAAAEAAHDAAIEALEEIAGAILSVRLRPAGCGATGPPSLNLHLLALKARVIKAWSRPDMWSDDPGHADAADRALAEICDAVMES